MKTLYTVKIFGKVQGVCFRMETKEKADELGITGFVQNKPDNSVYIKAEAGKEKLDEFVKWCRKGPKGARIESVEIAEELPKEFKEFIIQHE